MTRRVGYALSDSRSTEELIEAIARRIRADLTTQLANRFAFRVFAGTHTFEVNSEADIAAISLTPKAL